MAIMKIVCPGCATILKSSDPEGFAPDTRIKCAKCKEKFTAADGKAVTHKARPVEDDADEQDRDDLDTQKPKKKKKKVRKSEEGGSYKTSPARFVVLGVLPSSWA